MSQPYDRDTPTEARETLFQSRAPYVCEHGFEGAAVLRGECEECADWADSYYVSSDGCRTCHRPWTECEC